MAKILPLNGKMVGKVGGIVYAVNHGIQTMRAAAESVSNPSTPAQVQSRAKLKLLSQLSASIQSVIAIARDGLKTARNQFTQVNYQYTSFDGDTADIELADIQLTKSNTGLPGFIVDRSSGTAIHVELEESALEMVKRVVYVVLKRNSANVVVPFASVVCNEAGVDGLFPAELPYTAEAISIHAYGIDDRSEVATAKFGDLVAPSAETVAKVIATRTLKASDYALTQTRGLYLAVGETTGETSGIARVRLSIQMVSNSGNPVAGLGTVSGAGSYEAGSHVTLRATAIGENTFLGWRATPTGEIISSAESMLVTVNEAATYYAVFAAPSTEKRVILEYADGGTSAMGSLSGSGAYEPDTQVSVQATPNAGYSFNGWYDGPNSGTANQLSTESPYRFTMGDSNITLYAAFGSME